MGRGEVRRGPFVFCRMSFSLNGAGDLTGTLGAPLRGLEEGGAATERGRSSVPARVPWLLCLPFKDLKLAPPALPLLPSFTLSPEGQVQGHRSHFSN